MKLKIIEHEVQVTGLFISFSFFLYFLSYCYFIRAITLIHLPLEDPTTIERLVLDVSESGIVEI